MPFFNYVCEECGQHVDDKFVKKPDEILLCPVCNNTLTKQPSGFNFSIDPATPRG